MKLASSPPWKQIWPLSVGLGFGPALALSLVHFVVAGPGELDGVGVAAAEDLAGDAAEGELSEAVILEEDVGRLHHLSPSGR